MAKIVIDPGHGGYDPGASGNGLIEKQWVLEVSLELAKVLRSLGHAVKLTRSTDTFVGLSQRAIEANRWGADIFISVHLNAGGGANAKGWEDFIFNGGVSNNTRKLQNDIHDAVKLVLTKHGMKNRGKKSANFAVLRETRMPAILIEGGFVDSSDHNILRKDSYKKDLVVGVANGIQNYFGLNKVVPQSIKAGWKKNNTGWWYQNADGSYPRNQWQKINGTWYLFDSRGYMLTGWQKVKDTWYYMSGSGAMQTGWAKLKDVWYYLNSNGSMATGWRKVNNRWYYMNNSGAMQTGLITIGGKHYYLERSGALITDESIELEANKHGHLK